MSPLSCLGSQFNLVQSTLGMPVLSEVFDELEHDEKQKYSVSCKDGTWEFSLSSTNRIETIFLYLNKGYGVYEGISSVMSKDDIISLLGTPDSFGEPHVSPILGSFGGWEKYKRYDHYLHIEHIDEYRGVSKVTLQVLDPSE
jgi:hypothetical protein